MTIIKRSAIILYTDSNHADSHKTRIALAEKNIAAEIKYVDLNNPMKEFIDVNPYHTLPTLVDRELILHQANIIMEYFDDRFPHPPLIPVYPVSKAKTRLMIHRIEQDWYKPAYQIEADPSNDQARETLYNQLVRVASVFGEMEYFLSQEFSLVDCCIAPLLWRLPSYGISLSDKLRNIREYANRIFERESFKTSLSDDEIELNEEEYVIN